MIAAPAVPAAVAGSRRISALKDRVFQSVFSRTFAFTLLLEDAEVDETYFEVDERSSVLSISGAGCSIAGMLSAHPRRIDVVDGNRHHLAITALKVAAARGLRSHDELYQLFGYGTHPSPQAVIAPLTTSLAPWIQAYWKDRARLFASSSFYHQGLMGQLFRTLRPLVGTDAAWLRDLATHTVPERIAIVDRDFGPVLRSPAIAAVMRSPVFLLANGINYTQHTKNIQADQVSDAVELTLAYVRRCAYSNLDDNWLIWNAAAGTFNHERPTAVPPYLRRDRHSRALEAPTDVRFHAANIFDVLGSAGPNAWTHINLCDAIDWMPAPVQAHLLRECVRTTKEGGVVLYRSVEDRCLVEDLGLSRTLQRIEPASTRASAEDRSCLYRRVNFYRVVH